MWYVYAVEYYSAIKKEWNNAICSNINGPRDDHTKWSWVEDKYITYMWNLKKWYKWTYLQNRNILTDLENVWSPKGKGGEG